MSQSNSTSNKETLIGYRKPDLADSPKQRKGKNKKKNQYQDPFFQNYNEFQRISSAT